MIRYKYLSKASILCLLRFCLSSSLLAFFIWKNSDNNEFKTIQQLISYLRKITYFQYNCNENSIKLTSLMRFLLDRGNRTSPKVADWFNESKLQQLILYKNNIIIYNHDPTYQPSLVINALKTKKRYTI